MVLHAAGAVCPCVQKQTAAVRFRDRKRACPCFLYARTRPKTTEILRPKSVSCDVRSSGGVSVCAVYMQNDQKTASTAALFLRSCADWARHLKRERPRLLHETTQDRTPGGAALTGARPGRRPGGRNNKTQNPHSGTVEARRPVCHVRVLLL